MAILEVSFALPLTNQVLIFAIVLMVVLLTPFVMRQLNMPGIIGLILMGVLIGPHGLNLVARGDDIVMFGTIGLLYIMFLAALEVDLNDFIKVRNRSLIFGLLTFSIPVSLGTLASYYVLGYPLLPSLLLASMFGSHTMVAYPLVSRLGLTKREPVIITIGGTIVTDTLVLVLLALVANAHQGELDQEFWVRFLASAVFFAAFVGFLVPRISRWFFRNVEGEGSYQFLYVLAVVFVCAFLAEVAGVEPIIGAFLAGLALNRLIPHKSVLMNRIEFVGNTLFIPFFLISTGMLVDIRLLFQGYWALYVAGVLIVVALATKFMAAWVVSKLFNYGKDDRNLIFGLSGGHAAATLAIISVGFRLEIIPVEVLNGTILLIMATCLVATIVAARASRKISTDQVDNRLENLKEPRQRILIPLSYPSNMQKLMELAIYSRNPDSHEPLYPLVIIKDDAEAGSNIKQSNEELERGIAMATGHGIPVKPMTRIDLNSASGISRAAREIDASQIIMGWNARKSTSDRLFGSVLDNVLETSVQMITVARLQHPVNTFRRIALLVPQSAESETGFGTALKVVENIRRQLSTPLVAFAPEDTLEDLKQFFGTGTSMATYMLYDDWAHLARLQKTLTPDDLIVVVKERPRLNVMQFASSIVQQLPNQFSAYSFIIIYPNQGTEDPLVSTQQGSLPINMVNT